MGIFNNVLMLVKQNNEQKKLSCCIGISVTPIIIIIGGKEKRGRGCGGRNLKSHGPPPTHSTQEHNPQTINVKISKEGEVTFSFSQGRIDLHVYNSY